MARILLHSNIGGAASPSPAIGVGAQREPFLAFGGFNAGGTLLPHNAAGYDLIVHTGPGGYRPLISPLRQVELIGNQNIGGQKTFSGQGIFTAVTNISIGGGTAGQVLSTNGTGTLSWITPSTAPTLTWGRGLTETAGTVDLDLAGTTAGTIGGVFVAAAASGINLVGGGLSLVTAGAAQIGGVVVNANTGLRMVGNVIFSDPASQAQATTGTDNNLPITSLVLKLGADPATLTTTAKTLVPAINELRTLALAAAGALRCVGTYNATSGNVTPTTGSPLSAGALPAATAAMNGYFVIVSTAGTPPAGNAPQVPMTVNDWLVVTETTTPGTYAWSHLNLDNPITAALNVTITAIAGIAATNVQAALAELQANKLDAPLFIDTSLKGDGQSAGTPLAVDIVDGGTFT